MLPCRELHTHHVIDRKWLNGEFVCRRCGKVFEMMTFGYGEAVCPICYDGEQPFLWWDGRFWLNRLMKKMMKTGVKIGVIALIMLLLPNGPGGPLGNFAYASMQYSPSVLVLNVAPAPLNATELMELFEYVNGTLATISERLDNMAKATDMNVRRRLWRALGLDFLWRLSSWWLKAIHQIKNP